jgi:hypothetical protein
MCRSDRTLGFLVAGAVLLLSSPVDADEDRWRFKKLDDGMAMLFVAGTDDATDAFDSSYFQCKVGSGLIRVIETNMKDKKLRTAVANLIINDNYPTVNLDPGPRQSVIDEITSYDNGGWGYRFQIDPDVAAFNVFKATGYFSFKIGNAKVHSGVKAGLQNIAEFQSICRRQPRSEGAK